MASEKVTRRRVYEFAVFVLSVSVCFAVPIEVGDGNSSAQLYIEWKDGFILEYSVSFESASITGLELFDIVEAETTLETVREDFGFGIFVDGISYEDHNNIGFGGGDDWWHYWINNDDGQGWKSPAYGVADRILYDGDSDGWIYGHGGEPIPEPATIALFAIGALVFRKRCRRT